jgi:hypothetical protein
MQNFIIYYGQNKSYSNNIYKEKSFKRDVIFLFANYL